MLFSILSYRYPKIIHIIIRLSWHYPHYSILSSPYPNVILSLSWYCPELVLYGVYWWVRPYRYHSIILMLSIIPCCSMVSVVRILRRLFNKKHLLSSCYPYYPALSYRYLELVFYGVYWWIIPQHYPDIIHIIVRYLILSYHYPILS